MLLQPNSIAFFHVKTLILQVESIAFARQELQA